MKRVKMLTYEEGLKQEKKDRLDRENALRLRSEGYTLGEVSNKLGLSMMRILQLTKNH